MQGRNYDPGFLSKVSFLVRCSNHLLTVSSCWDGKSTDSPDHFSHMSYPTNNMDMMSPCPASHPVKVPQVMLETVWDTRPFNDKSLWPTDGSQPFVWSYGDKYVLFL